MHVCTTQLLFNVSTDLVASPSVLESEGNWLVPEQPAPECESVPGCDTTRLVVGGEDT